MKSHIRKLRREPEVFEEYNSVIKEELDSEVQIGDVVTSF